MDRKQVLTQEQKQEYLAHGGNICPFCKSKNISGTGRFEIDSHGGTQEAVCETCGKSWLDCYKLVDVESYE